MNKNILILLGLIMLSITGYAQVTLSATGSNDTYGLINSALAPGYSVIEAPDCGHADFGNHIDEVFDVDLNAYVFRFFLHTDDDNDRCLNFDRQRNEIKTYDKSPDNLLGVEGETVVYKWKFKLDAGFQPSSSFTHLHQIKAVGGDESGTPKITLTARDKTPDDLELRYAETDDQVTVLKVDLDLFKGNWVEVEETIVYGEIADGGSYDILIKDINSGNTLLSYTNNSIRMWNTDADFMRPKWGIYRSLNDKASLRDEEVFFTDFSIEEINSSLSVSENEASIPLKVYQNIKNEELVFSEEAMKENSFFEIYNSVGQLILSSELISSRVSVENLKAGLYFVRLINEKEKTKALKIIIN